MRLDDTIAAIATLLHPSGLGVIRVSGKHAVPLVGHLFKSGSEKLENTESHTWPNKLNIPMFMLNEIEWVNIFQEAGLKDVISWRANKTSHWAGTLVITGKN